MATMKSETILRRLAKLGIYSIERAEGVREELDEMKRDAFKHGFRDEGYYFADLKREIDKAMGRLTHSN